VDQQSRENAYEKSRKALRDKASACEYLAFLTVKYEVDPDEFFGALSSAWEGKKTTCKELSIRCRGKTQDEAIFLILEGSEVVAQFPISNGVLMEGKNPITDPMEIDMVRRHLKRKNEGMHSLLIRDLRIGMKHVSLRAKVLEIPKPKLVFTRFGKYASVLNALVADGTGTIKLCLWNDQIDSISNGDTIQIEDAQVSAFRGERQLSMGRKGTLCSVVNPCS
jgi:replication factor A1